MKKNPEPKSPSRQVNRRENFKRRIKELLEEFGFNITRKVRRRIAWDSLNKSKS